MYKIIKILGRGSFGQVYVVRKFSSSPSSKNYALKKISIYNIRVKEKSLLINEIRILKYCNCPYILKFIDFVYNGTNIDIITTYVRRGDLYNIIKKRRKKFDEATIWSYFIQACLGIQYLHNNNIIHRDLKSSNILINIADNLYIADFGSAKVFNTDISLTQSYIGTPLYFSPEVIRKQEYSFKIDIWALGCILFELITFNPPFMASNMKSLTNKILTTKFSLNLKLYSSIYSKILLNLVNKIIILDEIKRPNIKQLLSFDEITQHNYLIPYITHKSENINNFSYKFRNLTHKTWNQLEKILNDKL